MKRAKLKLNESQKRFCHEYLIDHNGTQAAIRAGYSANSASVQAADLLAKANIQGYVRELLEKQQERLGIRADKVVKELERVAYGDVRSMFDAHGNLLLPANWDDDTAACIAGVDVVVKNLGEGEVEYTKKIKRADKLKALELLARHFSLFNDKLDVNVTSDLGDRLERARERMMK